MPCGGLSLISMDMNSRVIVKKGDNNLVGAKKPLSNPIFEFEKYLPELAFFQRKWDTRWRSGSTREISTILHLFCLRVVIISVRSGAMQKYKPSYGEIDVGCLYVASLLQSGCTWRRLLLNPFPSPDFSESPVVTSLRYSPAWTVLYGKSNYYCFI